MSFLFHSNFSTWLIEFQVAAFVVLLVSFLFLLKLKPGVGRVFVCWSAAIAIAVVGTWLAIPERPVVQHVAIEPMWHSEPTQPDTLLATEPPAEAELPTLPTDFELQRDEPGPTVESITPTAPDPGLAKTPKQPANRWSITQIFALTWATAFVLVTVWNLIGRVALIRLLRRSRRGEDPLRSLFESLNTHRSARLLVSSQLEHAIAVGVLRPRVLVPSSLSSASELEQTAVLKHELAHIENRDLWLLTLLRWLGPFAAIQPLFWLLKRRLRESQELLADQRAAGEEPVEYAELLVQWARGSKATRRERMLPAASILPFSQTGRRVMALVDAGLRPRLSYPRRWLAAFAALLVVATASTAAFTIRPEPVMPQEDTGALTASADAVVGRVLDPDGKPVANVSVLLREVPIGVSGSSGMPAKSLDLARSRTNAKGEFQFTKLSSLPLRGDYRARSVPNKRKAGPFNVVAFANGFAPAHTATMAANNVTLNLAKPRLLSGELRTELGKPIANAQVRVVQLSQPGKPIRAYAKISAWLKVDEEFLDLRYVEANPLTVTTDAKGRYSGIPVPENKCITLEADHPDFVRREFFCATTQRPQKDVFVFRSGKEAREKVHLEPPTVMLTRGAEVAIRVLFADTEEPAVGAMIDPGPVIGDEKLKVDSNGEFRIRQLHAGSTYASVMPPDKHPYLEGPVQVKELKPGSVVQKTVKLRRAAVVRGRVIDATSNQPIPSAKVFLRTHNNQLSGIAQADQRGEFYLRTRPVDGFAFVGRPVPGYRTGLVRNGVNNFTSDEHEVAFQTTLDEPADVILKLQRAPGVRGVCIDENGKPVSGVEVQTTRSPSGSRYSIASDEAPRFVTSKDGAFDFSDLYSKPPRPEDDYIAIAIQPAKKLAAQFRITREHTGKPLQVELKPMESVEGQVLSIDGKPLAGATVELTGDWFNSRSIHRGRNAIKTSDEQGRFSFDRVIPGVRHHVQVRKKGFENDRSMAEVRRENGTLTVKPARLIPIIEPVKPLIPSTRGMRLDKALAVLSAGMPGKQPQDYPGGRRQYLLDCATWGRALREFAKRHPGTDFAFDACIKILDTPLPWESRDQTAHAVRAIQRQAGQILLKDFADRKELSKYIDRLIYDDRINGAKTARQLIAGSPHPEVVGIAMWHLSRFTQHADLKQLETIRDKYGKLTHAGGTLGEAAEEMIRLQKYYRHGKVPRDIVGETLDGKQMKLSDYKGKVIVLYFWATWSSGEQSVLAQMDQLNRMSRSMKGKPFQVLGVCIQDGGEDVIAKAKPTWPNWNDGRRGPISKEWGVRGRRLVLIDHTGKIIDHDTHGFAIGSGITQAIRKAEQGEASRNNGR